MRFSVWRASLAALAIGLLASALLAFPTSGASATVMVELDLDDMIRDADSIVHATVVGSDGRIALLPGGGARPDTLTTLRVHEWIAGAGGDTVRLRELGGTYQGRTLYYEGTPRFEVGEEVVLFLERRPEAPHDLRTLGMVQGKFIVRHGVPGVPATVRRDLEGISFMGWADGRQTISAPGQDPAMALDDFLDHLRRTRTDMSGGGR